LILVVALVLIRSRYQSKINEIQTQNKIQLEKERIGRDLHDSLGSQLSSISIGLNRLAQSQHIENIQTVVDLADKAVAELRDSLWAMDKESITVSDLEQRIIGLFWQYRKIDVSMELEVRVENELSDVKLASGKAGHLFRIVQEAMHNCIKHSRASYFKINFLREPGFIRVTMKDDGLGFDSQHPQGEHYGLKNIQLRARRINATCTISSAPGKGVKIDLLVPHEKQQIKNL
jgi:signal transduction histidine kinase